MTLKYVSLLSCLVCVLSAPTPPSGYEHHINIVADMYDLWWTVDGDFITFEVHAKTLGYVGFGISRKGGMKGADIVMGWVKDGSVFFQDRYSERDGEPPIDDEQNWELLAGREEGEYTILKFRRPLISCDKTQDMDITDETTRLIYAFDTEDPVDAASVKYHGRDQRGTKSVILVLHAEKPAAEDNEGLEYFDLLNPEVEVPAEDTTYWCEAMAFPTFQDKKHIVKYEPIIQEGHEGLVHHIIAYACYHPFNESSHLGRSGVCYQNLMGEVDNCDAVFLAWAIGGGPVYYPEHIGFPIGRDHPPTMIRLETHYDNPAPSKSGIIDSSGLRVWYTSELREYDAAILETGAVVDEMHAIPPQFPQLLSQGICPSDCLSQGIPEGENLRIFGVMLHSHLLGTAITVRHFRDGKELAPIAKDEYYDFNYQDYRPLREDVIIMPNDDIIVECNYASGEKTTVTYGGLKTREEMCLAYLWHYPKRAFSRCSSSPVPLQTVQYLQPTVQAGPRGANFDFTIETPAEFAGMTYTEVLESTDWSDASMREKFQQAINAPGADYYVLCNNGRTNPVLENPYFLSTPEEAREPYVAPEEPCTPAGSATNITYSLALICVLSVLALSFSKGK